MRFTDEIQIDRAYHKAVMIIERQRNENTRLRQENMQLKNRPEPEPITNGKNFVIRLKKDKLQDPLDEWTSHHFIVYFQSKFKNHYDGEHFSVKNQEWKAYSIRIKQFRNQNLNLGIGSKENKKFKEFIDWCFDKKFNRRFIANIPVMTSTGLFMEFRIATGMSQKPVNYDDLVAQIPKTSTANREKLLKDSF